VSTRSFGAARNCGGLRPERIRSGKSYVSFENQRRRNAVLKKWVYQGVPPSLLFALVAFVQFYALRAFA
jgi:hypothetical protein